MTFGLIAMVAYGIFAAHYKLFDIQPLAKAWLRNFGMGLFFLFAYLLTGGVLGISMIPHLVGLGLLAMLSYWLFAWGLSFENHSVVKNLYFLQYGVLILLDGQFLINNLYLISIVILIFGGSIINSFEGLLDRFSIVPFGIALLAAICGGVALFWVAKIVPIYGSFGSNMLSALGATFWASIFLGKGKFQNSFHTPNQINGNSITWHKKIFTIQYVVVIFSSIAGGFAFSEGIKEGIPIFFMALFLTLSGSFGTWYYNGYFAKKKPSLLSIVGSLLQLVGLIIMIIILVN